MGGSTECCWPSNVGSWICYTWISLSCYRDLLKLIHRFLEDREVFFCTKGNIPVGKWVVALSGGGPVMLVLGFVIHGFL